MKYHLDKQFAEERLEKLLKTEAYILEGSPQMNYVYPAWCEIIRKRKEFYLEVISSVD